MTDTSRWAVLSGIAGLVANALLVLFFALSRPWTGQWSEYAWLGSVNDAVIVVQFGALVPVALAVRAVLGGRVTGVTAAAVTAMVAVMVLQSALLTGLLTFDVQVWAVVVCFVVVFGWVLAVSRAGRDVLAPAAVRVGTVCAVGFLAGIAVAGLGALVPEGPGRYAVWGVGGLAGLCAWLVFPVWTLALARRVPARAEAVAG
ncbi:MAG TPA: hypothetical protein VNP92_12050 [Actinophytocola sp.]|nr:hypothetical protein [Actinophytocola sp.]